MERRSRPDPRFIYSELMGIKTDARDAKEAKVGEIGVRMDYLVERIAKLIDALTGEGHPPSPPAPIVPSKVDSTRKIPSIALLLMIGVGATATARFSSILPVREQEVVMDKGLQALRDGNYVKAEHEFTKKGEKLRLAEVFILQQRYDEAIILCENEGENGQAKFLLGWIAKQQGDKWKAESYFAQAEALHNPQAIALLVQEKHP